MGKTDFGKIADYADFVSTDPFRNGLHYPAVIEKIGDVEGKRILDVGCGDGFFTRMLAQKGARLVGYDISPEKIEEAKNFDDVSNNNIQFLVATPKTLISNQQFDVAVSVMVLPYATSSEDLKYFFESTFNVLKSEGCFVSIIFNPLFERFGEKIGSRRFERQGDNNVQVNFLNPKTGDVTFTSVLNQFTKQQYELAAKGAGFGNIQWFPLSPTELFVEKFGEDFWKDVISSQPYSLFVVTK